MVGAYLAYALQETGMDKWVEDGPLAKAKHDRMINTFDKQTMEYALVFFMSQLMPPSLTVEREQGRKKSITYIAVTFIAPGFTPGQSILDIQATTSAHISGYLPNQALSNPYLLKMK